MIYNNLIYFLVVIFAVTTDRIPDAPWINPLFGVPAMLFLYLVYSFIARYMFQRLKFGSSNEYFKTESRLSILAVIFFGVSLFVFDLKYYLEPLSIGGRMPVFANYGGIAFFFVFFCLMWINARSEYQHIFHREYSPGRFVVANLKTNLPILLPWLVLTLVFDLLLLADLPGVAPLLDSNWGDLVIIAVFLVFLLIFFPPMVRWLWNCTPLPDGLLRRAIEEFFRKQDFSAEIFLWPLFEGQVLTAGVMGLVPRFRYVLVTPALIQTMNWQEIEAVLAHEIGHVKKKHLLLYVLLFISFSVFFSAAAEPLPIFILTSDWFYSLSSFFLISPELLLAGMVSVPLLLLVLIYFRFIFGYFIRNFERQADIHVFSALGDSTALINSFEKIARLSGKIRDRKNWHHFGLGERIAFLEKCEQDKSWIKKHDKKVYLSLGLYFLAVVLSVILVRSVDLTQYTGKYEPRYVEAVIRHELQMDPDNGLLFLLLGDILVQQKMERDAVKAYERALKLKPDNADINNNLAWLLLSAKDASLRNPIRALELARRAAALKPAGYILDTLAVALWTMGSIDEAVVAEKEAVQRDPENREYYRQQLQKFNDMKWKQETP